MIKSKYEKDREYEEYMEKEKHKDYWSKRKKLGIYTIIFLIELFIFVFII